MSISVEQLDDNYKDYYKDLSILPKDVKVPTKVIKAVQKSCDFLMRYKQQKEILKELSKNS